MNDAGFQSRSTYSMHTHSEQRTLGGLLAYLLSVPAVLAVLVAPTVVFGAVLGVAGLTLGGRVVRQLSRVREENEHATLTVESPPQPEH